MVDAMNVLIIGNGAREHAISDAVMRSNRDPHLFAFMKAKNPGIASMASIIKIGSYEPLAILDFAKECGIELAVIGPEDPLANGVADMLNQNGIPTVGPTKEMAQLETSKFFTRLLLDKSDIPGNPKYRVCDTIDELRTCLAYNFSMSGRKLVLKPDGLTGGKGVMVQDDHFDTFGEAMALGEEILRTHGKLLVEEKLDGEEFSLQCFCDGITIFACPPVQDHKRRLVGDQGLNTGGMGSYSCANHLLPFLVQDDIDQATLIVKLTAAALSHKFARPYKGVIYGGFMATAEGVKLIEFNARFGDPEAMNVLPLLKTDFLDVCWAIVNGTLNELKVEFYPWNTVVKYVVPINYGKPYNQHVMKQISLISVGDIGEAKLFHSSINADDEGVWHMTSSRAAAVLGIGDFLSDAELIAEAGANAFIGQVEHRSDIGTAALIAKRVRHMEKLRKK